MKERPDPIIRLGTGHGSLVVIPGAHAVLTEVASAWNSATPDTWTVVTLPGSEPSPSGGWSWPHALDVCAMSVLAEIEQMELTEPTVLAGFSIGSAIACHVVNSAELEVSALIAVAPSSRRGFDEIREIATHVFLLVIGGANDPRIEEYRQLEADLDPLVGVKVEIVDGLGHSNPPDLGRRIESFLRTVNRD
jgi:surfactin synthase thioesterase subunit